MNPKSIIDKVLTTLTTLGDTELHAFVTSQREHVLREIGLARSAEGRAVDNGIDFGSASLAKLAAKLKPEGKDEAKAFVRDWSAFAGVWRYVSATGRRD